MTGEAVCITNDVARLRSCTVAGEHRSNCDGYGRRVMLVRSYDRATHRTIVHVQTEILADVECNGCLPRPAVGGTRLCEYHERQVASAINEMPDLITHLWSLNGSAPTGDGPAASSGFGPRWTLTDSRITASQIMVAALQFVDAAATEVDAAAPKLHAQLSPFSGILSTATTAQAAAAAADLHAWLADIGPDAYRRRRGAERAVEFAQLTGAAYRRYPTEDHTHRIPVLRCRTCNRMALEWHPPLYYLGDDSIVCGHCGSIEDRSLYEHDVAVILQSRRRK